MKKIMPILTKLSGEIKSMENVLSMWIIGDTEHRQRLANIKSQCHNTLLSLQDILLQDKDIAQEKKEILNNLHLVLTASGDVSLKEFKQVLTLTQSYVEKLSLQQECDNPTLCKRIRDVLSLLEGEKITAKNISRYCTPDRFELYFKKYDIMENGRRKMFLELARQARSWMRKGYKSFVEKIHNEMDKLRSELPILPSDVQPKINKANLPNHATVIRKECTFPDVTAGKVIKSRKTKHAVDTDEDQTIPEQSNILENTLFKAIQDMALTSVTEAITSESETPKISIQEVSSLEEKVKTPKDPILLSFIKDKNIGKSFEYLLTAADNSLTIDTDNPKYLLIAKEMYELLLERFPDHADCIQDRRKKNDWEIADYLATTRKAKPILPSLDGTPIEDTICSLDPKDIDPRTGRPKDIFLKI